MSPSVYLTVLLWKRTRLLLKICKEKGMPFGIPESEYEVLIQDLSLHSYLELFPSFVPSHFQKTPRTFSYFIMTKYLYFVNKNRQNSSSIVLLFSTFLVFCRLIYSKLLFFQNFPLHLLPVVQFLNRIQSFPATG